MDKDVKEFCLKEETKSTPKEVSEESVNKLYDYVINNIEY